MCKTKISIITILLICFMGMTGWSAGQTGLELKVLSFNIRYGTARDGENHWDRRSDLVMEEIRRQDSDVIGLQEALRFQIDAIQASLSRYGEIGVGRDDGYTKGEYCAILYRHDRFAVTDAGTFWLSDTPLVPGSTNWGNTITRICTWARFLETKTGRSFYLFNVHLDHRSQRSREKSTQLIMQRIQTRPFRDPVVLTGDFNAGEDNPAILHIVQHPKAALKDTYRVLYPEEHNVGTFNGFKGTRTGSKIDYIFVSQPAQVLKAEIVRTDYDGRWPSDHFAVSARLDLPQRTQGDRF